MNTSKMITYLVYYIFLLQVVKQSMYSSQKAFYDESQLITAAKKRAALTAMLVHSVAHYEFSRFFTPQN